MLRLTLLGTPLVELNGQPLTALLQSRRALSLLAYLAVHADRPQPRSLLAALFWPDISEALARRNVTNLVWRLQGLLGEAAQRLHVAKETVCLVTECAAGQPCWIDVQAFEEAAAKPDDIASLENAIRLYRGDLLQGLPDEWIVSHTERLRELHLRTLQQLVAQRRIQGNVDMALNAAQRWMQADALDEDAYYVFIELCIEAGQASDAIHAYQAYEHLWRVELDLPPSTRMQMLMARFRQLSAPHIQSTGLDGNVSLDPAHNQIVDSATKLARLFKRQYLYDDALTCYDLTLQHLGQVRFSDSESELTVRRECDEIFDTLGQRDRQSTNLDHIEYLATKTGNPKDMFDSHIRRLWSCLVTDAFAKAEQHAQIALNICEQHKLSQRLSSCQI